MQRREVLMKKYEFVAQQLYTRIKNEEFSETKKLPTEDQLMEEYSVSRNTIRNAVKELIKLGLLYPVQGSGMFVRENQKKDTVCLTGTRGVSADHLQNKISTVCLKLEIVSADKELAKRMHCQLDTPIYYIERLRYLDNKPYAIEYTYYNKDIVLYLNKEIAEQSIYSYIKNDLKLSFGFADKYISAAKLTKKQSELLALEENDPAICIEDNVYLSNGELFNSSLVVYNYKLANFFMSAE